MNFPISMEQIKVFLTYWGLKVIGAAALLVAGYVAARLLARMTRRGLERTRLDRTLHSFIEGVVFYSVMVVVAIATLGLFGVETTSFVAVIGTIGLAVGLALQGTLSNFASGVMLLVFRPFRVGDLIDAGGIMGTVEELGIFTTRIHTPDNVVVIIPNSAIYGQIIKVFTANPTRRVDLVVGISYEDDIGRAIEVIRETLKNNPLVLDDPEPTVAVGELADSSVNLVVRPWCRVEHYWDVYFGVLREVKEALDRAGISIPYPQHDVHIIGGVRQG